MNRGFMMVTVPKDKTKTPVWTEVEPTQGLGWKPVPASQSKFIPKSDFNEARTDEKKTKKITFPPITNGKVFPASEDTASKADSNVRSFMRERRAE